LFTFAAPHTVSAISRTSLLPFIFYMPLIHDRLCNGEDDLCNIDVIVTLSLH